MFAGGFSLEMGVKVARRFRGKGSLGWTQESRLKSLKRSVQETKGFVSFSAYFASVADAGSGPDSDLRINTNEPEKQMDLNGR